ncbi:hypothetical protein TcasGA2_TC033474 [Tribolium castaneum]|uniref:Uncharacterized protein n=1 Tax=Tribolium castaneum TaxID=7070 RepID=A0A139WGL2_TRICA|nr:hypothetical protein TcasGA2_TC033474 [Tribolium castaneum]
MKLHLIKNIYDKSIIACGDPSIIEVLVHTFHCKESLKLIKIQIPNLEEKSETISHLISRKHNIQ